MKIYDQFKYYTKNIIHLRKQIHIQADNDARINRVAFELITNVHSIEKGLSIPDTKLGFGQVKVKGIMHQIEKLKNSTNSFHQNALKMGVAILKEYFDYHISKEYESELVNSISKFLNNHKVEKHMGGTIEIENSNKNFDINEIEKFFLTRHSIRDFAENDVDLSTLKKALILAQKSPSACNRQGFRAYVLNQNQIEKLKPQLQGAGGFVNSVNKFILITGKISAYHINESYQYIVSASMYAAYLTLTLHLYNLGSCVIQRPVIWHHKTHQIMKEWMIPEDEQAICLLAVGNLKDNYKVPISHRMTDDVIHFL